MSTPILVRLAAVAIGVGLFATQASANEYSRHSNVWWGSSSGYAGSPYDEYSYPGIRWYGDSWCDGDRGYGGGYGHRSHRHGKGYGHRRHGGGHHRRHRDYDRDRY